MKKCIICKKDYDESKKNKGAIYCSRRCKERNKQLKYIRFRKESCECCGFVPVHMCQLDVDHIDGNRNNNKEDNLQTLCSNCHRLKTFLNKDWDKET